MGLPSNQSTIHWAPVVARALLVAIIALGLAAVAFFVAYRQAYRPPTAISYDRQQQCISKHRIACDSTSPKDLATIDAQGSSEELAFLVFILVTGIGTWRILRSYHRPGLASGTLGFAATGLLIFYEELSRDLLQAPALLSVEDVVYTFVIGWLVCAIISAAALTLYSRPIRVSKRT